MTAPKQGSISGLVKRHFSTVCLPGPGRIGLALLTTALWGLLPLHLQAGTTLDAWLENERAALRLPALGAVIVSDSGVEAIGVSGRRSITHETPVEHDDRWHLGSITKSITATLAARLVARGQLDFDDTVGALLGQLFPDMHQRYHPVTLRQLLSHRGGMPEDLTGLQYWQHYDPDTPPVRQRHKMLTEVLAAPPLNRPGRRQRYSNAGYVAAAIMLEAVSGHSYETLLEQELIEPLGLTRTGLGAPGHHSDQPDQPWGHRIDRTPSEPVPPGPFADHPPALAPAGTVHASLADLGHYLRMHLLGAQQPTEFLPPALFRTLHQPVARGRYALGWFIQQRPWASEAILIHEGSNTRWMAIALIAPSENLALALVSNQVPDDLDAFDRLADRLARSYLMY